MSSQRLQVSLKKLLTQLEHSPTASQTLTPYLISHFTSTQSSKKLKICDDYTTLLTEVFERRRLQIIDTGAEKKLDGKEMTRRSAARSGFQMPTMDEGFEDATSKK
ncbi:hypothetical protein TrLO_g10483 [Triparma laevis f. longispina]|uniref:Uncharacterized protein n=1 Tax=Triparma laevis f. longispina TaxID=1714387 RepID=A0A9W7KTR4_9STRA|nr:hypothetical protein TrLO_g10483 [Triparma laevis f. longispina]